MRLTLNALNGPFFITEHWAPSLTGPLVSLRMQRETDLSPSTLPSPPHPSTLPSHPQQPPIPQTRSVSQPLSSRVEALAWRCIPGAKRGCRGFEKEKRF